MTFRSLCVSACFAVVGTGVCSADEAYLLMREPSQYIVARAGGLAVENLADVGVAIPSYGSDSDSFALAAYDRQARAVVLRVLERGSHTLRTFPLGREPVGDLSGPFRGILLTDRFAYFLSVRSVDNEGLNRAGGWFDFNRLTLADGTIESTPVPKDCLNPRLAQLNGVPLVFPLNGAEVWRLDEPSRSFRQVSWRNDLNESRDAAAAAAESRLPGALFSDYVAVPDAGLFRLSRRGLLQQVLTSDLTLAPPPARRLDLGPPDNVQQLIAGSSVIGVVRKEAGRLNFLYIDARTLGVLWSAEIPAGAVPASFYVSAGDAVYYVDSTSRTINRLSGGSARALWTFPAGTNPSSARILAAVANSP